MKQETWNWIQIIVIIILIITIGFLLYYIRTEGTKCLANPLVYGAKSLTETNGEEFSCVCRLESAKRTTILVDSKSMTVKTDSDPTRVIEYNEMIYNLNKGIDELKNNSVLQGE